MDKKIYWTSALTFLSGIIVAVIGYRSNFITTDIKEGASWDLQRAKIIYQQAVKSSQDDKNSASIGAWACYHSIVYDCIIQEWNAVGDKAGHMKNACPPSDPKNYEKTCNHPGKAK